MANPFIGEVILFGGNYAPKGWMLCQGQLLPIDGNDALFQVIGTTYGGDGRSTLALPNLQGRVPVGQGQGPGLARYTLGEMGGEELHTLTETEMPKHQHSVAVTSSTDKSTDTPGKTVYLADETTSTGGKDIFIYAKAGTPESSTQLAPQAVSTSAGGAGHQNVQPVLAVNYCIAIFGMFPAGG